MTDYEILINPREANQIVIAPSMKNSENISIQQSKQQSYQNASFTYIDTTGTNYTKVTIGSDIEISIDGSLEFEGFVSSKRTEFAGGIILELQCTGRTFELDRYMTYTTTSYASMKTAAIAYNLLATFVPVDTINYSTINTSDGVTIQSIAFNSETLQSCFRKLTEYDGFNYYLGSRRVT